MFIVLFIFIFICAATISNITTVIVVTTPLWEDKELAIATPKDWRDMANGILLFLSGASPHGGSASFDGAMAVSEIGTFSVAFIFPSFALLLLETYSKSAGKQ